MKQLVEKGVFEDDPQVKRVVEETIRACEEEGKKAGSKPATEVKPGR